MLRGHWLAMKVMGAEVFCFFAFPEGAAGAGGPAGVDGADDGDEDGPGNHRLSGLEAVGDREHLRASGGSRGRPGPPPASHA